MKLFLSKLICVLLGLAISIALGEFLVARFGNVDTPPGLFVPSHTRGFAHRPRFQGHDRLGNPIRINSRGLRDRDYPLRRRPGVFRVFVLGDSVAFGDGVRGEDSFPKKLEEALGRGRAEVLNAGVRGYNTYHQLQMLKEIGLHYHPDLVIVAYVLNDAEPLSKQEGLIGQEHRTLIRFKNWIKEHSYLYAFFRRILELARHRVTPERFVETYDDQFAPGHPGWQLSKDSLKAMRDLASAKNFDLLLAVVPRFEGLRADEHYPPQKIHDQVLEAGRELGIDTVDLLPAVKGHDAASLKIASRDIFHPNPAGHDLLAKALADAVGSKYFGKAAQP